MASPKEEEYRDEIYSLQILLSRNKAGPGRTVKQEQEEFSPNHVQRLNLISVRSVDKCWKIRAVHICFIKRDNIYLELVSNDRMHEINRFLLLTCE